MEDITKNLFQKFINSNQYTLIDFYAPWCGPCRMLAPVLEEASTKFTNVKFAKINVDENQEIAKQYKITSIPTIIIFKNNQVISTLSGYKQDPQEVFNFIADNINEKIKK